MPLVLAVLRGRYGARSDAKTQYRMLVQQAEEAPATVPTHVLDMGLVNLAQLGIEDGTVEEALGYMGRWVLPTGVDTWLLGFLTIIRLLPKCHRLA